MKFMPKVGCCLVAVVGLTMNVCAELVWEKGKYTLNDVTPSEHNITRRATPSALSLLALGDGNFSNQVGINNTSISFTFPKADVYAIRVFTYHGDAGRDGISISSIAVQYSYGGEWTDLGAPAVSHDPDTGRAYVFLTDSAGGKVAEGVYGVKFVFPVQDHSGTNYTEIEIVGDASVELWPFWANSTFAAGSTFQNPSNVISRATSEDAPAALNDGVLTTTAPVPDDTAYTWTLPEPADIRAFAFHMGGGDAAHDGLNVLKIEWRANDSDVWTEIPNSRCSYDVNGLSQCGVLARTDYSVIAANAIAVRVTFGAQDNGFGNCAEFQAFGDRVMPVKTWSVGVFDKDTWVSNVSNLLVGSECTGGANVLHDGVMQPANAIYNNAVVTWTIPVASTIYGIDIYGYHGDGGRDRISVTKLELREEGSDEWIDLGAQAVFYDPNRCTHFARFSRCGAKLGENIVGLRITFGEQENGYASYGEIEMLGVRPPTAAVLHSVVATPTVFTADWAVRLSSVGGGEGRTTVNLWTSTNNCPFELSASTVVTDVSEIARFSLDYEAFKTVTYRIELVNSDGTREYRSTNAVSSVALFNNATYFWKECRSGTWQDVSNWTNSYHNDARLGYPNARTCTADLSVLGEGKPVTITATGYTEAKMTTLPPNAVVTWKADGVRIDDFGPCIIQGTNIYDGCKLFYQAGFNTAANAYLKFCGSYAYSGGFGHYGADSVVEVTPEATLDIGRGGIGNRARYVVDSATISTSGAFVKGGLNAAISCGGIVELRGGAPKFRDWGGHAMMGAGSNPPFTIRFFFPPRGWSEPAWGFTNVENPGGGGFGGGSGTWRIEVMQPATWLHYGRALEVPLVESLTADRQIYTNNLEFVVYGETVQVGKVLNRWGDYLYYTYDNSDARVPREDGMRPTGIRFHFAGRSVGTVLFVR